MFNEKYLKEQFMQVAGKDGLIDFNEYKKLYQKYYPHLSGERLRNEALRSFELIDTNESGYLTFEEYMSALRGSSNFKRPEPEPEFEKDEYARGGKFELGRAEPTGLDGNFSRPEPPLQKDDYGRGGKYEWGRPEPVFEKDEYARGGKYELGRPEPRSRSNFDD